MKEGELVALLINLPNLSLSVGDVGTVAYVYESGQNYEVEFVNADGDTIAVETLKANQIQLVTGRDAILHVRFDRAA
ncbi:DUF4926 domain-containing protein [Larkinella terrae]|uniref:DUF4926 domain-containing protein n=1 Tax=Larkinella terrae TaxID=2025311 RepID=A0A7K0EFY4_9BACT|nr:DUF4926 domain-containing protein [Larkinella terrae]MRS60612.1 DUF4926 domain-containing protein [Larkinella terrae]